MRSSSNSRNSGKRWRITVTGGKSEVRLRSRRRCFGNALHRIGDTRHDVSAMLTSRPLLRAIVNAQRSVRDLVEIQIIMRLTSITAALSLLLAGVSALDTPLDIQVEHAVECSRKTKRGMEQWCLFRCHG